MQKEICVGIVGANANNGWAKVSHVPAINSLPGLKLAAVATRNEQSAKEAAQAFGAERWFSDPFAMIKDERIDIITISVKVPAHRGFRSRGAGCKQSGVLRVAARMHSRGHEEDGDAAEFTSYRDRAAGTFESSRTPCKPAAFFWND